MVILESIDDEVHVARYGSHGNGWTLHPEPSIPDPTPSTLQTQP